MPHFLSTVFTCYSLIFLPNFTTSVASILLTKLSLAITVCQRLDVATFLVTNQTDPNLCTLLFTIELKLASFQSEYWNYAFLSFLSAQFCFVSMPNVKIVCLIGHHRIIWRSPGGNRNQLSVMVLCIHRCLVAKFPIPHLNPPARN